jgi:uncharacterized protein YabN with tetrapyrrole methylase and pyrophosphatase domain
VREKNRNSPKIKLDTHDSLSEYDVFEEFYLWEKQKHDLGSKWGDHHQLIKKISDVCGSISEVIDMPDHRHTLQERLGELILIAFSFCTYCNFCPKETTEKTLLKFQKRLDRMKQSASADGYLDFNSQSAEIMLSYWRKAKKLDNSNIAQLSEPFEIKADIFEKVVFVENQARAFGFKWGNYQQLITKVLDECQEVSEAIERSHKPESVQEELGDLILASLSFSMYCGFYPKETIEKSLNNS